VNSPRSYPLIPEILELIKTIRIKGWWFSLSGELEEGVDGFAYKQLF
jgi:hypothetical protein